MAVSRALNRRGFRRTNYRNLAEIPSVMLDTQYRMHSSISAFPNKAFYESKLMDGTLDETGAAKAGLEPPRSDLTKNDDTGLYRTVTFLHHTGQEITRAKSIVNESEAKIIYDVVVDLLLKNPVSPLVDREVKHLSIRLASVLSESQG